MEKKCFSPWDYLWVKLLCFICLIVFPLLFGAMAGNRSAERKVYEVEFERIQELADSYILDLNQRMAASQTMIYYLYDSHSDLNYMKTAREANDEYIVRKYSFCVDLKRIMDISNGGDGYFFYISAPEDLLVRGDYDESLLMMDYINDIILSDQNQIGWNQAEIEGIRYLVLTIRMREIIFGSWIRLEEDMQELTTGDFVTGSYFSDGALSVSQGNIVETVNELLQGKLYLHIQIDESAVTKGLERAYFIYRLLLVLDIVTIPCLLIVVWYMVIKPLQEIEMAQEHIRKGNLSYRIQNKASSREFQDAYDSFNEMAEDIRTLRIENYEKEQEKQRIQLRNLQLQIRPHFLLNTFSLIFALVQKNNREATQDIVMYLSDYFRFLTRNDAELIAFSEEYKLIQGYIRMTNVRYKNRVRLECDMDQLMQVKLPPLLVHNFIENAIKYGLAPDEELEITLKGSVKNGWINILVTDDGNGMEQEDLIRNRMIFEGNIELENETEHIGLYNSMQRLKYFYGDKAQIIVNSEPGGGTAFEIRFPQEEQL